MKVQVQIPDELDNRIRMRFGSLMVENSERAIRRLKEVSEQLKIVGMQKHYGKPGATEEWVRLKEEEEKLILGTQPLSVGSIFVALLMQVDNISDDELIRCMNQANIRQGRRPIFR